MNTCEILKSDNKLPAYATPGSAGFDLYNRSGEDVVIPPGMNALIKTGLFLKLPDNTVGFVLPRSGKSLKTVGFSIANSPGCIDEDYRNEVGVIACNYGKGAILIEAGERMAQMVVLPYVKCDFVEVDELGTTERDGGFGHTGDR
jgi:dUTP pyrophosphatase